MVKTALIPAAGLGTRMRPFSLTTPKELVALGSVPAIEFTVLEARAAGIERVVLVIRPDKGQVADYLHLAQSRGRLGEGEIVTAVQEVPLGLADAIYSAREHLDGEPFALLLPDNVILSEDYGLSSLVEAWEEEGRDVVGVLRLDSTDDGRFGHCGLFEGVETRPGTFAIHRIYSKKKGVLRVSEGETLFRTCGRYICHPDVIERIERMREQDLGELDEVPIYQDIARERGVVGVLIPRPLFDVGVPRGVMEANAWLLTRSALED